MLRSDIFSPHPAIRHGFFTRQGGVSEGLYASLNCGPGSADDPASVAENRRRVCEALGAKEAPLCTLYQVHGREAVTVSEPLADRPKADALVTDKPGIVLGILTADCGPVLFADPINKVIGAAHAGWRGAHGGVVEATVRAMVNLGAKPGNIVAALGPCIAQCSYEVGAEFKENFLKENAANDQFFSKHPKPRFDLKSYIAQKLEKSGVKAINILANDTFLEEDAFFSYRRTTLRGEPDYGRQISAIMITEQ